MITKKEYTDWKYNSNGAVKNLWFIDELGLPCCPTRGDCEHYRSFMMHQSKSKFHPECIEIFHLSFGKEQYHGDNKRKFMKRFTFVELFWSSDDAVSSLKDSDRK